MGSLQCPEICQGVRSLEKKHILSHPKALNPSHKKKKHQNYQPTFIHLTKLFIINLNCQKEVNSLKKEF